MHLVCNINGNNRIQQNRRGERTEKNRMKWNGIASNGMGWHRLASDGLDAIGWHGMASNGMEWHWIPWDGIEWHGIALDGIGWHKKAWDGIISHWMASDNMGMREWRGWLGMAWMPLYYIPNHQMAWDSITGINKDYKKHLTPGKTQEIPGFIHATFVTAYDQYQPTSQ